MALGDVYSIRVFQTYQNQRCLNVFFYRQFVPILVSPGPVADVLRVAFQAKVVDVWRASSPPAVIFERIEVVNLFDETDVSDTLINQAGTRNSLIAGQTEQLPVFTAVSIKLDGTGRAVKDGKKRLAGLYEADQNGTFLQAPVVASYDAVAQAFRRNLDYGSVTQADGFEPVLVKRVKEVVANQEKYRLPRTQAELVFKTIARAAVEVLLTTQSTRKVGRGV